MGIRLPFHLILLLTFAGLIYIDYRDADSVYQKLVAEQAERYQQVLVSLPEQDSGESLYTLMAEQLELRFFQFIDDEDSRANYTFGSLADPQSNLINKIFPQQNNIRSTLNHGHLQVLLAQPAPAKALITDLQNTVIYLTAAYLFLAFWFTISMIMLKRRIVYAAAYIGNLPKFQFNSVEGSKLVGLLSPLAGALDNCRRDLKLKMDEVASEQDKLNKVAFQDPLTGFGSPQKFARKLDSLAEESRPRLGVLAQIKATELGNINQEKGHKAGDDYLLKIANAIRRTVASSPEAECFRITSGDFAVFVPDVQITQAMDVFGKLKTELNDCQQQLHTDSVAYTGIVPCPNGSDPATVLALADTAVTIALTLSPNTIHILEKAPENDKGGENQWQEIIKTMITQKAIGFYQQPILPCRSSVTSYRELLARFYNHAGNVLPTQTVLAMAKKYGLSAELDKAIITCVMETLHSDRNLSGNFGVNISGSSVSDDEFLSWLKNIMLKHSQLAARLVFEVSESSLQANLIASARFVKLLHGLGAKISVEQFGHGFTSFRFFREVRPDYIKLDGSYSTRIDEDGNNRFYVRTLVDIARRAGILVVATTVERQEEKIVLEKLLIDGLQGFYIAQPKALTAPIKPQE